MPKGGPRINSGAPKGSKNNYRHGMSYTPTHKTWRSMKARCLNPNDTMWKYYGGRGITVCERWLKFDNFFQDMGTRPQGKTLDRIDVNAGYSPENCRWATALEQRHNQRRCQLSTQT